MSSADKPTLCSFDPSGEWFALVTHDARLKVWGTRQTGLRLEYAVPNHLAESVTSLSWGAISADDLPTTTTTPAGGHPTNPPTEDGKKRKRSLSSAAKQQSKLVALGLRSGDVVIVSLSLGKEAFLLKGGHTKKVTDFAFAADGRTGYSAGGELVVEWNIREQKDISKWVADKKAVQSLTLSQDGRTLLAAGNSIKLWSLQTRKVVQKWIGHTTAVRGMALAPQGTAFVSFATEDRTLDVWTIAEAGASESAAAVLSLDSNPVMVDTHAAQSSFQALAVSEDGQVLVWSHPLKDAERADAKKKRALKSDTRILVVDEKDAAQAILAARFTQTPAGPAVLIARGSTLKPVFETVQHVDADGRALAEVRLQRDGTKGLLMPGAPAAEKRKSEQAAVTVLGAADSALAQPRLDSGAMEGLPTLEEKMMDLDVVEKVSTGKQVPKAGSLQQVLVQALQTGDNALLEQCLLVRDLGVVQKTVERLPPPFVIPFLTQLIDRFQRTPNRGSVLGVWIRITITHHTAYLMTVPNLVQKLSGLYQTVDSRLSVFKRLLRLSGRLDLIMAQVAARSAAAETKEAAEPSTTVYNDDDEVSDEDATGFGNDDADDHVVEAKGRKGRKARPADKDAEDETDGDFGFETEEELEEEDDDEDEDEEAGEDEQQALNDADYGESDEDEDSDDE